MNIQTLSRLILLFSLFPFFSGCGQSMVISRVNYSQPMESVITPGEEGTVNDMRYGISFNILPVQFMETGDTSTVSTREVRLIRGSEGYYYLTAPGYRHVYLFSPEKHRLRLEKRFLIQEEGIGEPAFNQREGHVQLLSRPAGRYWNLTADGIVHTETWEAE